MGVLRVAAFAAMTSLAFIPTVAQASNSCWYPNEAKAAQIRGLQTMLMVGTLQCRRHHRVSEDLYNDFVRYQRNFLDANGYVLKARFMRENGVADGQGAYDRFGTSLANQYSSRMDDPEFCETVHHFARLAGRATKEELLELADAVAEAPRSGVCRPSQYSFDRPHQDDGHDDYARREPPPPPRVTISDGTEAPAAAVAAAAPGPVAQPEAPAPVEVAEAAAPAPAPEAAPASDAATAPVMTAAAVAPEEKLELVQQVKADAPAAADAPDTRKREAALQAAIVALQSAVVALQAASTSDLEADGEPGPVKAVELPAGGTN